MATQTEVINIVVREDGSRVVKRNLEDVGGAADKASNLVGKFKTLLAGIAGGVVVNQLRELADAYTNIQNRLRLTTTDQANLNAVFNELQAISTRTRSSLEANVELYSRVSQSAKDLGLSQQQILQLTESLNQAIKISGATAQEAEAGLRQLSQGLASGALRGDELVSVLENLPAVADVIAKSLGVTRGELRAMGAEGKITAQTIVTAFEQSREELADKFAKTIPTAAEGFVLLKNQLIETVGELDAATGASSLLGSTLLDLTNFLKAATPEIVNFGRALTGSLDPADELTTGSKLLASALVILYGLFQGLASLLWGTVKVTFQTVGKVIGGVVAAVVAAVQGDFNGAYEIIKETAVDVKDSYIQTTNEMGQGAIDATSAMFTKLDQVWNQGSRMIQDRSAQAVGTVSTQTGPNNTRVGPSEEELKKQQREIEKVRRELTSLLGSVDPLGQATLQYAKDQETLVKAWEKGLITIEQLIQYQQVLAAQYTAQLDPLSKLNAELDEQMQLLQMGRREREVEAQVLAASRDLQSQGVILTQQETQALREKFEALQNVSEVVAIQDDLLAQSVDKRQAFVDQITAMKNLLADPNSGFTQMDAITGIGDMMGSDMLEGTQEAFDAQLQQYDYYYEQIRLLREADLISAQTAAQMMAKIEQQQFEFRLKNTQQFFGTLAGLAQSGNSKIAKIGQAAALVQATIDAASAVMKAYASAPYPANIALAAAQAALSAVQISKIAGANTGFATGGEFRVGGSGGTDSQMVAFRATPGERVAVSTPQQVRKGEAGRFNGEGGEPVQVSGPTIINVRDPKEIPNAIQSSDGKQAIINVISDNAALFRQVLQSN
jgi:tape measure domain-containing protein